MLKELLKNKKFQLIIKEFYNKNKEIVVDILLFGSILKGKEKPADIDLLLITIKKINTNLIYEVRKKLEKINPNFNIKVIEYKDIFNPSFLARETFLSEAYSLITKKFIAKGLGFINFYLFKYDLKGLNKSKRMLFYYSLYGRNKNKGILKETNAIKFSETILLVPIEKVEEMREYFNNLKIKFIDLPILLPERIIKSERFTH